MATDEELLRELQQRLGGKQKRSLWGLDWSEIGAGLGFTVGGPILEEYLERRKAEIAAGGDEGIVLKLLKKLI